MPLSTPISPNICALRTAAAACKATYEKTLKAHKELVATKEDHDFLNINMWYLAVFDSATDTKEAALMYRDSVHRLREAYDAKINRAKIATSSPLSSPISKTNRTNLATKKAELKDQLNVTLKLIKDLKDMSSLYSNMDLKKDYRLQLTSLQQHLKDQFEEYKVVRKALV